MNKTIGYVMTIAGIALLLWILLIAETTGAGMKLGVNLGNFTLPAMFPIIVGFSLLVLGLIMAYSKQSKN